MNQALEALQAAIPKAAADPLRPRYHFLPPANWMNDPNGTLFVHGEYHLFYQFNPYQAQWGRLHWGHARSADLVHWEHLPIALAPAYGLGEKYCFSGCCVERDGGAVIYYTSIGGKLGVLNAMRGAQQWAAYSDDERLIEWQRDPDNPFLRQEMHGGRKIYEWRDPYVWQEQDGWYMLLSGKYRGERYGSVFLYTSPDLESWRFAGRLLRGERDPGRGWECPNMLKFGKRYFLLVSNYRRVIYAPGSFDGRAFTPQGWFNLDHGGAFYASNTYLNQDGA